MSSVFSCPTLFSMPHFYLGDDRIVASSGGGGRDGICLVQYASETSKQLTWNVLGQINLVPNQHVHTVHKHEFSSRSPLLAPTIAGQAWDADPVRDVWTYDVEPFSGFTVGAHKTYQVNNLVSRTAHAYPDLWVKAGSGAETGRAADFVTGEAGIFFCFRLRARRLHSQTMLNALIFFLCLNPYARVLGLFLSCPPHALALSPQCRAIGCECGGCPPNPLHSPSGASSRYGDLGCESARSCVHQWVVTIQHAWLTTLTKRKGL